MNGRRQSGSTSDYSERTALSERVARLETHREYSATREDVSESINKVEKRLSELTTAVATINISMATKTWILGGLLAFFISMAAAALHAYIRAVLS